MILGKPWQQFSLLGIGLRIPNRLRHINRYLPKID
jgi:hypothetical protein